MDRRARVCLGGGCLMDMQNPGADGTGALEGLAAFKALRSKTRDYPQPEPALPPTAREAYASSLRTFAPGDPDEVLDVRVRLLTARDMAGAALSHPGRHCAEARACWRIVQRLAGDHAYRPAPADELRCLADQCARLIATASRLDLLLGAHDG